MIFKSSLQMVTKSLFEITANTNDEIENPLFVKKGTSNSRNWNILAPEVYLNEDKNELFVTGQ